jgi:hypothetical protein
VPVEVLIWRAEPIRFAITNMRGKVAAQLTEMCLAPRVAKMLEGNPLDDIPPGSELHLPVERPHPRDTDPITSFAQIQFNASINIAQICIQDELVDLAARRMIDYERVDGTITFDGSRVYDLPLDFRSFADHPHFQTSDNDFIFEYPGGLRQLEFNDPLYRTTSSGTATHWYWESTTQKKVGFWPIPSAGDAVTYRYEKSVLITGQGNLLPFGVEEESITFCTMAGRRFKFMYESPEKPADIQQVLESDTSYRTARATLYRLLRGTEQGTYYGHMYC